MEHHGTIHPRSHPRSDPESLLAHGSRLRALARHLVGEGRADDLVQETWLRAVERGGGATPWSWLGRVLRNLALDGRRADAARAERERELARGEADDDEGERFALHKDLVAALERLEAPYRQAILLRYFEELPPRRIAARLGVPVKTVKTRLNRGLALLREELDRRHGGRETWLAAMVPLAAGTGGAGWVGGASAVLRAGTVLKLGLAAAAVSAGFYLVSPRAGRGPALGPPTAQLAAPSVHADELVVPSEDASHSHVTGAARTQPAAALAVPPAPALALTGGLRRGRVLDANGAGLAGVWVGYAEDVGAPGPSDPVQSDANGGFELPDLAEPVGSRDARFATVLASRLDPALARPEDVRVVVVAPPVTLGGVVRDDKGALLAGAVVQLAVPPSFRARFRELLETSQTCLERELEAETDAQGSFRFEGAPGLPCAKLVARWGHASSPGVAVPEHDDLGLELAVTVPEDPPLGAHPLHLVGEVRHADGSLAPGALVSLGGATTHADEAGLFELWAPRMQPGQTLVTADGIGLSFLPSGAGSGGAEAPALRQLVAVLQGEQAAITLPGHDARGDELWPPFAALWLGGAPRSIAGRVLGADGRALAGVPVWVEDLTFVAKTRDGFLTLEHQMAGKSDQWMDRWFRARSDESGAFELGGLCERGYTLAAMDPATLEIVRRDPLPAASTGVELVLDGRELERVAGRVLDTHGAPCPGVRLELTRDTFRVQSPTGVYYGNERLDAGSTDAEGRFELARVPRPATLSFSFSGPGTPGVKLALAEVADPLDVRVTAAVMARVQVAFGGVPPAQGQLVFRDAEDRGLHLYVIGGATVWGRDAIDLADTNLFDPAARCTPVLSVPDTARAVLLLDGEGHELRRVPLVFGEEPALVRF